LEEAIVTQQTATIQTPELELPGPSTRTRHGDASWFVRHVMGPMTKLLNPLIRRAAGRKHVSMLAQIRHRGRRSGRTYVTPASARPTPDGFLVPLTFGDRSDWCRNILAARQCTIRFKAVDYQALEPVLLVGDEGRAIVEHTFKRYERLMLRTIGVNKFLHLTTAPRADRS
jgi:deazaflavin-dependent oxidoreductase (nitroreductase family)